MSMEQIITALTTQVPDLAVLLIIVIIFIRYIEKRDASYLALTNEMNRALQELISEIQVHSKETADGISEMHRTVANRRKTRRIN